MIKCTNLSKEDLGRIGSWVAEAFLNEPGCFSVLSKEVADRMFTAIVTTCYETGHLYTTSRNQEGFCVYWTKAERPGLFPQLKLGIRFLRCLPLKAGILLKDSQNNWTPTEKRYKKRKDFVEIFLIAVRKEYQGQGYFRKMLEEPFALARKRKTICVLDTDSKLKAEKYCHVGFHVIDHKKQKSKITMYALEK